MPFGARDDLYQKYDAVVLVFADAFGWRFFEHFHQRSPFLRRAVEQGLVSKLTSQFPSTTAAHVTTIYTGLPVGESGVYEWYYYEPLLDRVIAPLLFSFAGDTERNTLAPTGVSAQALYPSQTLYQDLQTHGVGSVVFQLAQLCPFAVLKGGYRRRADSSISNAARGAGEPWAAT